MTTDNKKTSTGRKVLIVITLIIVLVLFAGVTGMQKFISFKKSEAAANMPENISQVTAMTVKTREWTPQIAAVGYIRPNQGAMLSAQASGTVTRVNVKSGQRVNKGDLLVELDDAVEEATLKASQAQLPNAKATLDRYRTLVASNSASKAELDNAQSTYNQLLVNLGQYISTGTEIVRVEDQSSMKIRFTLPQTDVEKIAVGQKVTAEIDALPGQTFPANIIAIDPAVDRNTGLINLEAVITEGGEKLLSGMFARLNVALPTKQEQIVVPQIAVTYTMYGETLYVLQPLSDEDKNKLSAQNPDKDLSKMYRAKQTEVKTLDRNGIYALLSKGVKAGDLIVTGGLQRLENHALVEVSDQEAVGVIQPAKDSKL